MFNSDSRNSNYAQKSVISSGLLGHGSKIPDRTIETQAPMDLCSKFQLSRCYTGREIGHRRTDGRTGGRHNDFSRAHFFKNVL
jgi:hypothetical protein